MLLVQSFECCFSLEGKKNAVLQPCPQQYYLLRSRLKLFNSALGVGNSCRAAIAGGALQV